jgi:Family of unknown function (DUF6194)
MRPDVSPDAALARLLAFDGELRLEAYYGERSVFYNPGGVAPLGVIFASVKERDGPNDGAARLSRPGVWRLAFGMPVDAFAARFGDLPARPPKGRAVALPAWDVTRLDELTPHPVYAWMGWVQILSPSPASFERLQPLLAQSLDLARTRWQHRARHATH